MRRHRRNAAAGCSRRDGRAVCRHRRAARAIRGMTMDLVRDLFDLPRGRIATPRWGASTASCSTCVTMRRRGWCRWPSDRPCSASGCIRRSARWMAAMRTACGVAAAARSTSASAASASSRAGSTRMWHRRNRGGGGRTTRARWLAGCRALKTNLVAARWSARTVRARGEQPARLGGISQSSSQRQGTGWVITGYSIGTAGLWERLRPRRAIAGRRDKEKG